MCVCVCVCLREEGGRQAESMCGEWQLRNECMCACERERRGEREKGREGEGEREKLMFLCLDCQHEIAERRPGRNDKANNIDHSLIQGSSFKCISHL